MDSILQAWNHTKLGVGGSLPLKAFDSHSLKTTTFDLNTTVYLGFYVQITSWAPETLDEGQFLS